MKSWLLKLSLKKKWTLAVGVTIFISYAIIAIVLYVALQTWLLNNEQKNAQRTVDDMTVFFETQGTTVTIQHLEQNSPLMKAIINQEQTVRIFNLDGIEVLRINGATAAAPLPKTVAELVEAVPVEQEVEGTHAYVVNTLVKIGPFQGVLQLIHPLATFDAMMKYMLTTLVITGLGALLLAVTLSYYLANVLIRPLIQLRESMTLIRDKGFEEKVDFHYTADDEIGDLLKIYETMLRELEIAFTQQQQFVADASHELRTPIQVLEGHLSMIERWGKHEPDILDEALHTSLEEIARMKRMIEELLQLARREKHDPLARTEVEDVVARVERELAQIYPQVTFQCRVVGQPQVIAISPNALVQIVRNLFENAIRYNEHAPVIETTIHFLADETRIHIQDNGIGMTPEQLEKIFDRFYRIDSARTQKISGTGLGLSITKMLVEKYGAKITVESEIGVGSIFTLYFLVK